VGFEVLLRGLIQLRKDMLAGHGLPEVHDDHELKDIDGDKSDY
jgi:hypothetical protein